MKELKIKEKNIVKERLRIKKIFVSELGIINDFNFELVTVENIQRLIKLYDIYILENYIINTIPNGIIVSVSNRMTSTGGKTIFVKSGDKLNIEIRISLKILTAYINGNFKEKICGIVGTDLLDGLMLILEHELCHVVEFSFYGNSSCKGRRFKALGWKWFRHSSSYHEISNFNESANTLSKGSNILIGDTVVFFYKNNKYEGVVININKRATVMVEDKGGLYKNNKGVRYKKWYVPLNYIK